MLTAEVVDLRQTVRNLMYDLHIYKKNKQEMPEKQNEASVSSPKGMLPLVMSVNESLRYDLRTESKVMEQSDFLSALMDKLRCQDCNFAHECEVEDPQMAGITMWFAPQTNAALTLQQESRADNVIHSETGSRVDR